MIGLLFTDFYLLIYIFFASISCCQNFHLVLFLHDHLPFHDDVLQIEGATLRFIYPLKYQATLWWIVRKKNEITKSDQPRLKKLRKHGLFDVQTLFSSRQKNRL